jgi:hydroxymethylpyrimidine/phosphomethylpyrimidine kinase
VEKLANELNLYAQVPIVIDPVITTSSGYHLIDKDTVLALKEKLLHLATVITPNLSEAEILLDYPILSKKDMQEAIYQLSEQIHVSVVIKSGCFRNSNVLIDMFYDFHHRDLSIMETNKIETKNLNGTGDSYSAAIACNLGLGQSLNEAVLNAKKYINCAIQSGANFNFNGGFGPVNHLFINKKEY